MKEPKFKKGQKVEYTQGLFKMVFYVEEIQFNATSGEFEYIDPNFDRKVSESELHEVDTNASCKEQE